MKTEKIPATDSDQTRIALLEQSIGTINQTLLRIEVELKDIRKDFKGEISDLRKEIKSDFQWLIGWMIKGMGTLMAMVVGLGAITAHGFHWF